MPIRPDLRGLYPPDWPQISQRIRFGRAGGRCERCAAPHGQAIWRAQNGTYMLEDGAVHCADTGEARGWSREADYPAIRITTIVLTTAHLDHDPANNSESNLRALCQRCHLAHDRDQHRHNAAVTRRRRVAVADLFGGDQYV